MKPLAWLALILLAQDSKSRTEFLEAVKNMDEGRVRTAARAVVAAESHDAVDVLLDGYALCAQGIKSLWQEKLKALQEVEKNSDFVRQCRATMTFSMAVIFGKSRIFWKVRAIPSAAIWCGGSPLMR